MPEKSKHKLAIPPRTLVFAFVAALLAGLFYSLWLVKFDHPKQSASHAASCTVTATMVDPCRPWLTAAVGQYPNVAPNTVYGQAQGFKLRTGIKPDAIKVYHTAGQTLSSDDKTIATSYNFLMLNWKPFPKWALYKTDPTTANSDIDTMANSLKTVPTAKIFLTIWHEPENDVVAGGDANCPNVTYKGSAGTVADYKGMWSYVHSRLLSDLTGTPFVVNGSFHNIVFAIDYMNYAPWNCLVPDLYPGDNITDWIVFNAYGGADGVSFDNNVQAYYNMFTGTQYDTTNRHFNTKALGIAEFSARNVTSAQGVTYFTQAKTAVEQKTFPKLNLYMLFDDVGPDGNENRGDYIKGGVLDGPKTAAFNSFVQSSTFKDPAPPDSTPPQVSINTPANGSTVQGTVTITANASDNVGVVKVVFSVNNTTVFTDTNNTDGWRTPWDSTKVSNGSHTVKAVAYDAAGNTATATSSIVVNNPAPPPPPPTPPAPVINAFNATPATVTSGSASLLTWSTTASASCTVTPGGPSNTTLVSWQTGNLTTTTTFTLTCKNSAGTTVTATTTVTVTSTSNPPPPVHTTPPPTVKATTGQKVDVPTPDTPVQQGDLVTLQPNTVSNEQEVKSITKVEFYNGTKLIQTITSPPYALDTKLLQPGRYTITQRTYFSDGTSTDSAQLVSITKKQTHVPVVPIVIAVVGVGALGGGAVYLGRVLARRRAYQQATASAGVLYGDADLHDIPVHTNPQQSGPPPDDQHHWPWLPPPPSP